MIWSTTVKIADQVKDGRLFYLLQWAPQLPKTRSGKIMRRILRKIAANEYDQLGDTSTLTDPAVVDDLVDNRQNR